MHTAPLFDLTNPYVLFNLVSFILVVIVSGGYLLNDRSRNRGFLTALFFSFSFWLFFSTLEYSAPTLAGTILFAKFSYFGIATLPVLYFLSVLVFLGYHRFANAKYIALTLIIPVITLIMVFTNEHHNAVWSSVSMATDSNYPVAIYGHGWYFWIFVIGYSYFLVIASLILLARRMIRVPSTYRGPFILIILSLVIPFLGTALDSFLPNPFPGYDKAPVLVMVGGFLFIWGAAQGQFSAAPTAHMARVLDEFIQPLIIINTHSKIEYFNNAAARLISISGEDLITASTEKKLTIGDDFALERFPADKEIISRDSGHERIYLPSIRDMTDAIGNKIGTSILFEDTTKLQEAQNQAIESLLKVQRKSIARQVDQGISESFEMIHEHIIEAMSMLSRGDLETTQALLSTLEIASTRMEHTRRQFFLNFESEALINPDFQNEFRSLIDQYNKHPDLNINVSYPNLPLSEYFNLRGFTVLKGVLHSLLIHAAHNATQAHIVILKEEKLVTVIYLDDSAEPLLDFGTSINATLSSINATVEQRENEGRTELLINFPASKLEVRSTQVIRQTAILCEPEILFADSLLHLLNAHGLETLGNFQPGSNIERVIRDLNPRLFFISTNYADDQLDHLIEYAHKVSDHTAIVLIHKEDLDRSTRLIARHQPDGVISMGQKADEIVHAVTLIQRGGRYLAPKLFEGLIVKISDFNSTILTKRLEKLGLNNKQSQIAYLIHTDMSYKEIANTLAISESYVKYHTRNIFELLGVPNRKALEVYLINLANQTGDTG